VIRGRVTKSGMVIAGRITDCFSREGSIKDGRSREERVRDGKSRKDWLKYAGMEA
jgi:hypothetical protein